MKETLIELRKNLREAIDRLDLERVSQSKRHDLSLLIKYLEEAKIQAGSVLRDIREEN